MKLKTLYLTIFFLITIANSSFAQLTHLIPIFKVEAGFHGLGIGYEQPLNDNWLTEFNLHAGGGFNVNPANEVSFHYIEFPSIHLSTGLKRFYNLHKIRRNHSNNAGNFLGMQIKYVSGGLIQRTGDFGTPPVTPLNPPINDVMITEIHWGTQRSISDRLFFTAKIGMGYIVDFHNLSSTLLPAGGVKLAYRIK